jgi:hypothetical protein
MIHITAISWTRYDSLYFPSFLLYFLSSSYALFYTVISECDCTPLQRFYKGCTQLNQKLARSWLMHSMHCGSAIFPYQALERRQAQETLIDCAVL